jgi:5-methylcytosine-specific restriction enzyme B
MFDCARIDRIVETLDRALYADDVTRAEQQRQEILTRFPRSEWPEMPLERYAIGQQDSSQTLGRWIEFATPDIGSIKGGSAHKHIIYKHGAKPGWHYDEASYPSVEAAWEAVRSAFVRAFALADEGRWDEIDAIPELRSGPALLTKTLQAYFPDELLPIFSAGHLRTLLLELDADNDTRGLGTVSLNRRLLAGLRSCPASAGWSTKELERLVYTTELNPFKKSGATRMVKIAPGEDAKWWDDCLANDYICVGWDDVGDLRQYETVDALRAALEAAYYENNKGVASQKARELWTLTELTPGDIIVANKGISRVLAIGTVREERYEWRNERPEGKHTVRVDWDTSFAKDIPPQKRWGVVTVASIPEVLRPVILEKAISSALAPELFAEIVDALDLKKQVVLYGPPGTGKTYQARRFVVWWLQPDQAAASAVLGDREIFSRAEHQLVTGAMPRRIWWMVANKSEWSWGQLFADGVVEYRRGRIQRNYPLVQRGDLVVGYQSTPEKRLVALARVTATIDEFPADDPKIRLEPVAQLEDGPTYAALAADPILSMSEPMRHRNQGTLFALSSDEAEHLSALLMESQPDVEIHLADSDTVGQLTYLTFHPSYSYEEFVEGLRPAPVGQGAFELRPVDGVFKRICRDARLNPDRRYVVLIDEINRANIAKVLGELITLLESDKRGMTVILPQSGEQFSVPANVFIVGTMNTADRSIRLLDVALRRRFAFIELMPNTELLQGESVGGLQLDLLLDTINNRIRAKVGREKQIGHSFFFRNGAIIDDPAELARVFRLEVLPLLQEYCYDDYGMLAEFVGEKIVDIDGQRVRHEVTGDPEKLVAALEELVAAKNVE